MDTTIATDHACMSLYELVPSHHQSWQSPYSFLYPLGRQKWLTAKSASQLWFQCTILSLSIHHVHAIGGRAKVTLTLMLENRVHTPQPLIFLKYSIKAPSPPSRETGRHRQGHLATPLSLWVSPVQKPQPLPHSARTKQEYSTCSKWQGQEQ